jgi:ferredoxin-NADP reductase
MPETLFIKLRIIQIIQETVDTKSFVFEIVDENKLSCKAGQFLTFIFYHYNGEEVRRSYSISSSPELKEALTITVKRIPNGEFSRWFFDKAKVGNILTTTGASGFFTLPEPVEKFRQYVFIAAGSGIAPVYSLIKKLLNQYSSIHVILIYSNTSPDTTIFYVALKALQIEFYERLQIEFLFSKSGDLWRARLSFSLLEMLIKEYVSDPLNKTIFYLCGPHDYMQKAIIELKREGVLTENIRKESFLTTKPVLRNRPPDLKSHQVTLRRNDLQYQFNVQYPVSILQQAKMEGIQLPYSCEAGRCGSCAITCRSGKVWMQYNEVLLDEDIKKGRVLTCTGFPIDGDVVLDY